MFFALLLVEQRICGTLARLVPEYVHRGVVLGRKPKLFPVCTENLSSGVVVVKSAKDGV